MASRDLRPEELEGIVAHPLAYDGIAVIVHSDNPISGLDSDQVRRIFRGEIQSWDELGGAALEPLVVNKAEGRATLDVFLSYFELENKEIQADAVIGDNAQGVRLVSGNPAAIGYVSIGEAIHAKDRGVPIKLIELSGVVPTLANVEQGIYPVRRTLYILFDEIRDQDRRVIDFLSGDEGRSIINELKFVPSRVPNSPTEASELAPPGIR
jgi:phosphate transport system substrate-binding protein